LKKTLGRENITGINKGLGANPKSWTDYYILSKKDRFKNTFDNFFDKIKYEKVEDHNSEMHSKSSKGKTI